MVPETENEIRRLEGELSDLSDTSEIIQPVLELVSAWVSRARSRLESLDIYDPVHQELIAEMAVNDLILSASVLDQVRDFDRAPWNDVLELVEELISKLIDPGLKGGTFAVTSPFETDSLESRFLSLDGSYCFVLLFSPKVDFTGLDLRGLVGHEVAHVDGRVSSFYDSLEPTARKTGQVLADVLAIMMMGPAFGYSLSRYAGVVRGLEQARVEGATSPSLACRIQCLSHIANEMWDEGAIEDACHRTFREFLASVPAISEAENFRIPRYLREARAILERRRSVMIHERRLAEVLRGEPLGRGDTNSIRLNGLLLSAS